MATDKEKRDVLPDPVEAVRGILSNDDFYNSLTEEVREQVNAHADEFHSQSEMRAFVQNLERRA